MHALARGGCEHSQEEFTRVTRGHYVQFPLVLCAVHTGNPRVSCAVHTGIRGTRGEH